MSEPKKCKYCHGSGVGASNSSVVPPSCPYCNGTGKEAEPVSQTEYNCNQNGVQKAEPKYFVQGTDRRFKAEPQADGLRDVVSAWDSRFGFTVKESDRRELSQAILDFVRAKGEGLKKECGTDSRRWAMYKNGYHSGIDDLIRSLEE